MPGVSHRAQLQVVVRTCLALPDDRAALSEAQARFVEAAAPVLHDLFQQLAEVLAASRGLAADGRDGLVRLGGGLAVPVHLIDALPGDELLAELEHLTRILRTTSQSRVAVTSLLGPRLVRLGLCEHATASDPAVAEAYSTAPLDPVPDRWCLRVRTVARERRLDQARPWKPSASGLRADVWLHAGKMDLGQLDFAVRTTFGVIAASVTTARTEAPAEAELAWLPPRLSDPLELGRALRLLRAETRRVVAEAPLLALEPALALARLAMLDDDARALRLVLDTEGAAALVGIDAATHLAGTLRHIPELEHLVPSPTLPPEIDVERLQAQAAAAVHRLLHSLEGDADPMRTQMVTRAAVEAALRPGIAGLPLDDVQLELAIAGCERLAPDALERVNARALRLRAGLTAAFAAVPGGAPAEGGVERRLAELLAAELELPGGDIRRALTAVARQLREETGDSELVRALERAAG